jgi:hypothetical protein
MNVTAGWDFRSQVYLQGASKMGVVVGGRVMKRVKKDNPLFMKWDTNMNPRLEKEKKVNCKSPEKIKIQRIKITIQDLVNSKDDSTLPTENTLRLCFEDSGKKKPIYSRTQNAAISSTSPLEPHYQA